MESFAHRLASGVRVSWASSPSFATVGTVLSTLLVLPLLDILFDVLLGADLSAPNLVRTGYAAALAALTTSVAGGVVGQVVADRNRGVFQEVHMRRRVDAAYWLSLGVVPTLLATTTGAAAIGAVHLLSPVHDAGMLGRVLVLAPVAVTCGLLMGVAAGGIGVDAPDPYLGLTIVSALLPLLTGVINYVLGDDVVLVSSSDACAQDTYARLTRKGLLHDVPRHASRQFLTTGDADSFQGIGERLLGRFVHDVEQVELR